MVYNFGLNLPKLISIEPKKNSNILAEGTYGLYDKKEERVVKMASDHKQIGERSREIIKYMENAVAFPSQYEAHENPKTWQLLQFLKDYELVFHEFTPISWQKKHRLDFVNDLYAAYYEDKFLEVLKESLFRTPLQFRYNEFIQFKKLQNRITIKKFPVLCGLFTKDDVSKAHELIEYLFNQFEESEFTLDVKTEKYQGTRVTLALKDQEAINYIGLTVFENWKVDSKIDFRPLIQYMDEVEEYIETTYLI